MVRRVGHPPEAEGDGAITSQAIIDGMKKAQSQFVICIKNRDYPVSLELRKIYRVVPDDAAAAHRQIRVIDESCEDYLYPAEYFVSIRL